MTDRDLGEDFEKADMILAEALQGFQAANVNPYIYGMALLEIGVAAMIKVGELEKDIVDTVKKLDEKIRPGMYEGAEQENCKVVDIDVCAVGWFSWAEECSVRFYNE